jgi:hypothetical protein
MFRSADTHLTSDIEFPASKVHIACRIDASARITPTSHPRLPLSTPTVQISPRPQLTAVLSARSRDASAAYQAIRKTITPPMVTMRPPRPLSAKSVTQRSNKPPIACTLISAAYSLTSGASLHTPARMDSARSRRPISTCKSASINAPSMRKTINSARRSPHCTAPRSPATSASTAALPTTARA